LKDVSLDVYGENFGVATEHKNLGRLTVYPKSIENINGCSELVLNIRFPIGITEDEIKEKISLFAQKRGFYISSSKHVASPFVIDENSEMVKMLCEVSKDVLGGGYEPYYMGGSTYANELPNAYVFGTGCNVPPDDFEKGRGEAHSVDEAASIDRLLKCSKIYARALLKLNEMDW
jgi:acetylornithine deacetylase/succinyl-diaminopimelate desuccinylase-like protein